MIDFWLFAAKFVFLACLYLFVFWAAKNMAPPRHAPAPAANEIRARVRIIQPNAKDQALSVASPAFIGRSPENDIHLPDEAVSSRHAKLVFAGGSWWVDDLNSKNGTFLNNKRLRGRAKFGAGDILKIGRTELVLGETGGRR